MNTIDRAALYTVTSRERQLGIFVEADRALAIFTRWTVLGLHDVRLVKHDGSRTPLVAKVSR